MASSLGQVLIGQEVRNIPQIQLDQKLKIATWNVKTLFAAGQFDNFIQEMEEACWKWNDLVKRQITPFWYRSDQNHVRILIDVNLQFQ